MQLELLRDPALPTSAGIERALREALADGRLRIGDRLPSSRDLAADLGVSRTTVVGVLDALLAEGTLSARRGVGTFVARAGQAPGGGAGGGGAGGADGTGGVGAVPTPHGERLRHDLRPGRAELGSFPTGDWLAASRRALQAPDALDPEEDGAGLAVLREALSGYLGRARGVVSRPEDLVVTAGFRGAGLLLSAALHRAGARVVALEHPSLPGTRELWERQGFDVVRLPVDGDGARVEALTDAVDVAVLTPSHQFPLGVALSARRRRHVLAWASRTGGIVVEDDYDGEFRFDRRPIAALQASAPEQVAYVGSASKTLAPGLRLGWAVAPARLRGPLRAASLELLGGAPVIAQAALADLIATGRFERHVRRQRREYERRRRMLTGLLAEHGLRIDGLPAGLHALVPVGDVAGERAVVAAAARSGVALHGLERYAGADADGALVVGFATPPRLRFDAALRALGRVLGDGGAGDVRPRRDGC